MRSEPSIAPKDLTAALFAEPASDDRTPERGQQRKAEALEESPATITAGGQDETVSSDPGGKQVGQDETVSSNPGEKQTPWKGEPTFQIREDAIRRGAAFRWKYRKTETGHVLGGPAGEPPPPQKFNYMSNLLGWHPRNRDGAGPNADRCEELLYEIIDSYDCEEADHGAIAIEENPNTPMRFMQHTIAKCARDPRLAVPRGGNMVGAMVGHSHINQIHRNCLNASSASHSSLKDLVEPSGNLSMARIQARSPAMANHIRKGLCVEMLSFALELEEPDDGVECVQSCLNSKHAVAMSKHEMQGLRCLEKVVLMKEVLVAGSVNLEKCRHKAAATGWASLAWSEDFNSVLSLVVDTVKGPWLKEMCDWHEDFVNSNVRKIAFSVIGALSLFPLDKPLARGATLKKAYDKKPGQQTSLCNTVTPAMVKQLCNKDRRIVLDRLETALHRFHVEYEAIGAYASLSPQSKGAMFLTVDLHLVSAAFNVKQGPAYAPERFENDWAEAVSEAETIIRARVSPLALSSLPALPAKSEPRVGGLFKSKTEALLPQIIDYDSSGKATSAQPTLKPAPSEAVALAWRQSVQNGSRADTCQRAFLLGALWSAQQTLGDAVDALNMKGLPEGKGKLEVVAAKTIDAGHMLLVPIVQTLVHIVKETTKPQAVKCGEFFLVPDIARKNDEFIPPFWCVRRSNIEAECNASLIYIQVDQVSTILAPDANYAVTSSSTELQSTTIPVMTNASQILDGAEIVFYLPSKQTKSGEEGGKEVGWKDQAKKTAVK